MKIFGLSSLLVASVVLSGCASNSSSTAVPSGKAQAQVFDLNGKALGVVTFKNAHDKIAVQADLKNLTPNSTLAFHVHEKGECVGDFTSAGPHFNPHGKQHGHPGMTSHAGDLGNIKTNKKGMARYDVESDQFTLGTDDHSVLGRAVVIHAQADDFVSQPAGNAGKRIGCGLIKEVKAGH